MPAARRPARVPRRGSARAGESGQLLALAGVVLVLALVGAMLAVNELSSERGLAQADATSGLPQRFRAARDEFIATLTPLSFPTMDNNTLMIQFSSIANETEQKARGNGLLMHVRLGNATDEFARKSEWNFTQTAGGAIPCAGAASNRTYTAWSYNGSRDYRSVQYDCVNDGILWNGAATSKVQGIVVYLFMADHRSRIEETLVMAVN